MMIKVFTDFEVLILKMSAIFKSDFGAKVVRLEQNYRSVGNVIATANAVISNNPSRLEKKMWTEAEDGELIHTIEPTKHVAFPDER